MLKSKKGLQKRVKLTNPKNKKNAKIVTKRANNAHLKVKKSKTLRNRLKKEKNTVATKSILNNLKQFFK